MEFTFQSDVRVVHKLKESFTEQQIIDEPMLFSAGYDFALAEGGQITRAILSHIDRKALSPAEGRYIVIDTRVHMLMPGMYPAIPGWHCDGWRRGENGQPDVMNHIVNLDNAHKKDLHWTAIFGDCSRTEFLGGSIKVDVDQEAVWKSVSEQVPDLHIGYFAESGFIYEFGHNQLHRATPATERGWRYFFRLSHSLIPPENEIRKQVQVYTTEHGGW